MRLSAVQPVVNPMMIPAMRPMSAASGRHMRMRLNARTIGTHTMRKVFAMVACVPCSCRL